MPSGEVFPDDDYEGDDGEEEWEEKIQYCPCTSNKPTSIISWRSQNKKYSKWYPPDCKANPCTEYFFAEKICYQGEK